MHILNVLHGAHPWLLEAEVTTGRLRSTDTVANEWGAERERERLIFLGSSETDSETAASKEPWQVCLYDSIVRIKTQSHEKDLKETEYSISYIHFLTYIKRNGGRGEGGEGEDEKEKKKPGLSSLWEKRQDSPGETFCHLSTQGNVAFFSTNLWIRFQRTGVYFDYFF